MRSFPASNMSLFFMILSGGNSGYHPWFGPGSGGVGGLMAYAMNWWIEKCNDPNVGYNQSYRNERTVDCITYYDCSSFVWYGLLHSGFQLDAGAWPFTTGTMGGILKNLGFKEILVGSDGFEYHVGDILVVDNSSHQHTEIVHDLEDGGHTMGAHGRSGRELPDQVSINTSTTLTGYHPYTHCYRFPYTGGDWAIGGSSEYFGSPTQPLGGNNEKQINNATIIKDYWTAQGWTLEAICGFLGNVQQESTFNPALVEIGGTGHGFVQWTPPTDLYNGLDAVYGKHDDWADPQKQLTVILAEYQQKMGIKNWGIDPQWYTELAPSSYRLQWNEYIKSTGDVGYLARVWEYCYERPASAHPERAANAQAWYEYFKKTS